VVALVAGIAGLDAAEDQQWAERFTALPGLNCPRLHVNDAVVAHAGALEGRPGIIAISGTGSIVFGVTESGRHIRNYDFHHYAATAARHIAFDAVHRVLAEDMREQEDPFIRQICAFWNVPDVAALRALGMEGFVSGDFECTRRFGELACLVTEAARQGSPLARSVCDRAAATLSLGIRLVGTCFQERRVRVALIGGAVRSPYMRQAMATELARSQDRRYEVVDPAFSCEAGAVLMALERYGIAPDELILATLRATSEQR
jgi:glucosamine kinase